MARSCRSQPRHRQRTDARLTLDSNSLTIPSRCPASMALTSRHTWREDQGRKRSLYRALGVAEYWQYDPTGDHLQPPLHGLRLVGGE